MKKIMVFLLIYAMFFPFTNTFFAEVKDEKQLKVEAQAGILMDFESGRVLWEKNADKPLAMASTTKIMTAIITLENGNLKDKVTVSALAASANPVKMHLQKGEQISLESLLYALMLQSSNDAAVAIAEHVGGSVENFCKMMTDKAIKLGAKDTVFETPNGLDAGNHHSTAYDLAVITRYALKNEQFNKIINTRNITVSSDKTTYGIYNKNRLLDEFEGANGVKTGFTGKAGHCFVGSAKRNGMQLISVVLASGWGQKGKEQKWIDTKNVLRYGFDNYEYEVLLEEGEPAGNVAIIRSKTDSIGVCYYTGFVLPLSAEEKETFVIETELPTELKAPVDLGEKVGVAKLYINGELCKEVDLVSASEASRFDLKTCMESVLNYFMQMGTNNRIEIILPEAVFGE